MYTCARQTSQGTQRCYTVSNTPEDDTDLHCNNTVLRIPKFLRQADTFHTPNLFGSDSLEIQHNVSDFDFDEAPYLTPTVSKLMRDFSDYQEECTQMD